MLIYELLYLLLTPLYVATPTVHQGLVLFNIYIFLSWCNMQAGGESTGGHPYSLNVS